MVLVGEQQKVVQTCLARIDSSLFLITVQVVDAVTGACSQICVHLSEPLFDMVLNMVYDYASTNVRTNAVRAIHQLVECVANANPVKTLAKFFPLCVANIRTELENGASSLRTTSTSQPLPSDATLHWNLAILRGAVYKYVSLFV
jgi:proteasome activator subunit 4